MVVLPVFVQAPWVHVFPFSAFLFSFILFFLGFYLLKFCSDRWSSIGSLLVGVSWSWLGGCLFWGWLRAHPVWHLPVEAIALPIAVSLLKTRWKIGASFYLASLLGTAFTDVMIVLTGVMKAWPEVRCAFFRSFQNVEFHCRTIIGTFFIICHFNSGTFNNFDSKLDASKIKK